MLKKRWDFDKKKAVHDVKDDSSGVDVDLTVVVLIVEHFRRDVARSPAADEKFPVIRFQGGET